MENFQEIINKWEGIKLSDTFTQRAIANVSVDCDAIEDRERNKRRTVADIKQEMADIKEILSDVMVEGQHYGVIPGCGDKKALLKPGAEKLSMTFRLRPIINNVGDVITEQLPNNHINIKVFCHIVSARGDDLATGVGSCSTMESKYRYRGGEKKGTGKPVPKEYWNLKKEGKAKEAQALIGGRGFSAGKIDGEWQICEVGEKQENPDIADIYNTVLKMAKKRAYVDGVLSATCASDIFTQDVEDNEESGIVDPPKQSSSQPPSTTKQESSNAIDGNGIITSILAINKRNKKNSKTGLEFHVYEITGEENKIYTASGKDMESFMMVAKSAASGGIKAKIKTKGDKYNTIASIDTVEPDFEINKEDDASDAPTP